VPYRVTVQNIDQDPADPNGSRRYLDQSLGVLPLSGQGILSVWRRRCHGGLLRGYVRLLLLPVRFILRQALLGQPKCDRRDQDYQVCLDGARLPVGLCRAPSVELMLGIVKSKSLSVTVRLGTNAVIKPIKTCGPASDTSSWTRFYLLYGCGKTLLSRVYLGI